MAKKAYVGVNNVARKVSKMYVGVNGIARKVKKAYVGVGGVARLFYEKLARGFSFYSSNTISNSYVPSWRQSYQAYNGKYWWIYNNPTNFSGYYLADRFTSSLTKEFRTYSVTDLGNANSSTSAVAYNKLYIHGNNAAASSSPKITACISTNDGVTHLSCYEGLYKASTSVNDKALFSGGDYYGNNVIVYSNTSYSYTTQFDNPTCYHAAATLKDDSKAYFWSGYRNGLRNVNVYDSSLTRSLINIGWTCVGSFGTALGDDYVMFGGGRAVSSDGVTLTQYLKDTFVINANGTKTTTSDLTTTDTKYLNASPYDDMVIIPLTQSTVIDVYTDTLTKSTSLTESHSNGIYKTPGRIGNYLAISSGYNDSTIDLFTPTY